METHSIDKIVHQMSLFPVQQAPPAQSSYYLYSGTAVVIQSHFTLVNFTFQIKRSQYRKSVCTCICVSPYTVQQKKREGSLTVNVLNLVIPGASSTVCISLPSLLFLTSLYCNLSVDLHCYCLSCFVKITMKCCFIL